jgi:ribose 5-phosphate isomerase B
MAAELNDSVQSIPYISFLKGIKPNLSLFRGHNFRLEIVHLGNQIKHTMKLGIAADHGGFSLKEKIRKKLKDLGHEVTDFGASALNESDDYPDFVVPLAQAVAAGNVERGIAICGSGVGASIAANKIAHVRAALVHDTFSAHQGVEDDDMNLVCLGGRVIGEKLAEEIIDTFLQARFSGAERHARRLKKIAALENH